jgi:hypothetical protein
MTAPNVEGIVEEYLRQLDTALRSLPNERRDQLVGQIREHIDEARSQLPEQSEAAVRNLLERLGRPEDIATEALDDEPVPVPHRSHRNPIAVALAAVALVAIGATAFILARPSAKETAPKTTAPTTQSSSTTSSPTTSAPSATVAPVMNPIPSGTYVSSSAAGYPHYYLVATSSATGNITGSVNFVYQDGQTSVVFTFEGISQNGSALLHPTLIPQTGEAAQSPSTVPGAISATYGQGAVQLGECPSYLHNVQSMTQCTFDLSPQGQL